MYLSKSNFNISKISTQGTQYTRKNKNDGSYWEIHKNPDNYLVFNAVNWTDGNKDEFTKTSFGTFQIITYHFLLGIRMDIKN